KAVGQLKIERVANRLQVRVGIATGLVVVGDAISTGAAVEQTVIGEAPLLAARLVTLACPSAVLISTNTRALLGNLFEYRDLDAVEVEGLREPVLVSQVLRESASTSRFEALRSVRGELIGRGEELDVLWPEPDSNVPLCRALCVKNYQRRECGGPSC